MIKNKRKNDLHILLLLVCISYSYFSEAQINNTINQTRDSLNATKKSFTAPISNFTKFSKQDSLLSFRRIKIRTSVTANARYYGLTFENSNLPKWTTSYQINNNIDVCGLPFKVDAFLGDKTGIAGRGASRIHIQFDAEAFARELAKKAMEDEKKKQLEKLENDSNFQKYKTASQVVSTDKQLLDQRAYQEQIQKKQNLVKQYESIGDTALLKKEIYKNAKREVDGYNKINHDLDSLNKYIAYADRINPMWKSLKDTTVDISSYKNLYDPTEYRKQIENSSMIPAPLKWLASVRRFEAGMVYPDFQPLIFRGAPVKGILASVERHGIFSDIAFGKIYSPGDFFRDTLVSAKVYALAIRAGYEYKKIKLSYTMLQTKRINSMDTFAFRYYFETPKEATVQGMSMEWTGKRNKFFIYSAKSRVSESPVNPNEEVTRLNDINRLLPGVPQPLIATLAFQAGYKLSILKTRSDFTLKYNYQGQYYHSPMRVFTQPPGSQYEIIMQQSLFKKQLKLKAGVTMQQSKFKAGYFSYNDQVLSYNFQLNVKIKKLPQFMISYLSYYRTSIYEGQEVILKMEQWTATANYLFQKKNQFISILGSYSRNKIENIYAGIYEQAALYMTYKHIKSAFGYNLIPSYFSTPMASADSARTYDIKGAVEYHASAHFIMHVGGGYAINKLRGRAYPYFDLSWDNIYVGLINVRADYTWLNEFGIYRRGMSVMCSITRKIF